MLFDTTNHCWKADFCLWVFTNSMGDFFFPWFDYFSVLTDINKRTISKYCGKRGNPKGRRKPGQHNPNQQFITKRNDTISSAIDTDQHRCQYELIPAVKDCPNDMRWKITAKCQWVLNQGSCICKKICFNDWHPVTYGLGLINKYKMSSFGEYPEKLLNCW